MDTSIISGLISAASAIIVCLISQRKVIALIEYKIEQLTNHVEKHNSVVERTYELEKKAEIFTEQMKVANHRIEDLEGKV